MVSDLFSRFRPQHLPESDPDEETRANPPLDQQLLRAQQETHAAVIALSNTVAGLEANLLRLSKDQFRSAALSENTLSEVKSALARLPLERLAAPIGKPDADTRLLEALMPILDSIEAGLTVGQNQCALLADAPARETLTGWLEGQRLLRDRLLALFDKESVRPIECLGQPFDPYRHVAVETVYDPLRPAGTIVEERRRGYSLDGHVLRYAEVVVTSQKQY